MIMMQRKADKVCGTGLPCQLPGPKKLRAERYTFLRSREQLRATKNKKILDKTPIM
jgi:hypothetical protein